MFFFYGNYDFLNLHGKNNSSDPYPNKNKIVWKGIGHVSCHGTQNMFYLIWHVPCYGIIKFLILKYFSL